MKNKTIFVLPIGTEVKINGLDGKAVITAVCVWNNLQVTYEVVWWDGRKRNSEWLPDIEFVISPQDSTMKIGFKNL